MVTDEEYRRSLNKGIREFAGRLGSLDQEWGFRCECGEPNCECTVVLSLAAFDDIKESGGRVLYPRHRGTTLPTPPPFTDTRVPIEYRRVTGRRPARVRASAPTAAR